MRFHLFDRIITYKRKKIIRGIKTITLADDSFLSVADYLFYPSTLCIEALAQLGGWFIGASLEFSCICVLAFIGGVDIMGRPQTGDSLFLDIRFQELTENNASVSGEIHINDKLLLKINRIYYGLVHTVDHTELERQKQMFHSLLVPE